MKNPLLRMPIRSRMSTILVAFLIPILFLGYEFNYELSKDIQFSEQESYGVAYQKPLIALIMEVSDHQARRLLKASGDTTVDKKIEETNTRVDALFVQLAEIDKELGAVLETTAESLKSHNASETLAVPTITAKWQALKTAPEYSSEAYASLISDLVGLVKHTGDTSNLILDGDLDTYYLMDAGTGASPAMLQFIASIKTKTFTLLHNNGGTLPAANQAQALQDATLLRSLYTSRIHDDLTTAFNEDANFHGVNPTLKPSLEPKQQAFEASSAKVSAMLENLAKGAPMTAVSFAEIMDGFNDDATALAEATLDEMGKMIDTRIADMKQERTNALLLSIGIVIIAFVLFFIVSGSISKPISRLQKTLSNIADGDTDMQIPTTDSKDEINQLYVAAAKLRNTVEDAFRLKGMVEDMPTGLMTVDTRNGLKVNFINKSLRKVLTGIESQLSVKADKTLGQPIDTLHSTLGSFKGLLASASNLPHVDQVKIGDEILSLQSAPITSKKGEYVGAMLTWEVITGRAKLADSFESTVKSVVTEVATSAVQMRGNAERLNTLADETKESSVIVAAAATEAAATANQVAAAAEELTASIGEISSQVQKSSAVASQASEQAESINQSMHTLVEKSNRVGEVIQFITNIASQINLLALNATIESARAGEAGKGFAVVASEVKNLANQTAKATEEIVQQVQSMQDATHQAVDSVGQIIAIISEISASTAGVAAAVEEQSAATNEISRNISHTAAGTAEISQNILRVEQGADETGSSSREVLSSAATLNEHAKTLSAKVDEFLQMVRSS